MNMLCLGYQKFFKDQINELLQEYKHVLKAPVKQLLSSGVAYVAQIHGVSLERGHVILKFFKGRAPRLREQKSFVLIKRAANERWGCIPSAWGCSFEEFLSSVNFHSSASQIIPLYQLHNQDMESELVGCSGVSNKMFRLISDMLSAGKNLNVIVFDTEPPTRYLANLADYIERNEEDSLLQIKPIVSYDQWKPELLAFDRKDPNLMSRTVLKALDENQKVVLQGPPGTGKSFCAAQIIADYLSRGKSVCVTAMANKALMELIMQPPLALYLAENKIAKTMMTSDEAIAAKGLKDAESDYIVPKGEALFATYYKFSNQFRKIENSVSNPLYDLVVIEEASQAYLTTISASLKLSGRCLIVGDPMQLSPIVQSENKLEYKHWNVSVQSEGLTTLVLGTDIKSFRITTTFRLTDCAAKLSGIFYGNTLTSVAPTLKGWDNFSDRRYFPIGGGTIYEILTGGEDGVLSKSAADTMQVVLSSIIANRSNSSVAIITPFRDSAKAIQSKFSFDDAKLNLSVETIDRVQGVTVDYTILYFPLRNAGFALNERRFNVATSRSRSTTLILSDFDLLSMRSIAGKVRAYLEKVVGVERKELSEERNSKSDVGITPLIVNKTSEGDLDVYDLPRLQASLNTLQVQLMEWLKIWLPIVYSENVWRDGVVKKLSELQYKSIKAHGILSIEGLDLNELLSVFIGSFREFQQVSHISQELQTLAFHVRDIRHSNAHRRTCEIVNMDVSDVKYHIDTVDRFLVGLNKATEPKLNKTITTIVRGKNKFIVS